MTPQQLAQYYKDKALWQAVKDQAQPAAFVILEKTKALWHDERVQKMYGSQVDAENVAAAATWIKQRLGERNDQRRKY